MQNLSASFIFQEDCRMKIEHVLFSSFFFSKLRIRVSEGHFQCIHTIRFSEPTQIGSLKTDRVNAPLLNDKWSSSDNSTERSYTQNQSNAWDAWRWRKYMWLAIHHGAITLAVSLHKKMTEAGT